MAYVPGFECDVFVSYAHTDNEPFGPASRRWVDAFHDALCTGVAQHLGTRPTFWRDPHLRPVDEFPAEIEAQLAGSAVFLPVFSPAYLASDWCRREFEAFRRNAEQPGGLRVENKLRIVKVVKTHVAREALPAAVGDVLGYQFYSVDENTKRTRDLLYTPGGETAFWAMVDDLAQDLAQLLKLLAEKTSLRLSPLSGVVYLAETTSDLEEQRRQIKRELVDRGYVVFPDRWLPTSADRIEELMRGYLERSDLYVQLLGAPYGSSLESDPRSIPALQYELYRSYRDAKGGCPGLLWSPPEVREHVRDERQRAFLAAVEASLPDGIDLLLCPIEELKSIAIDKLAAKKKEAERPKSPQLAQQVLRVYVVCDQHDKDKLKPLRNHLFDLGVEALVPSFGRSDAANEIRQLHYEHLQLCDGVLVYWGEGDDSWLQAKLSDIRKAPHYRQNVPLRAATVLISDPPNADKDDFRTREAEVVRAPGEVSPTILSSFLSRLGLSP